MSEINREEMELIEKASMTAKKKKSITKKNIYIFSGIGLGILCIGLAVIGVRSYFANKEIYSYKETTVAFGELTVGVTEDSTIDIGTVEQTFDLDISALVRSTASDSSSGGSAATGNNNAGGIMANNMFAQMMSMTNSGSTVTGDSNDLVVETVLVTAGQEIAVGDVLYTVSEDSVSDIKKQLEQDVTNAANDVNSLTTAQKSSKLTAAHTYESAREYGNYAEAEYNAAILELETTVTDLEKQIEAANEKILVSQEKIEDRNTELITAQEMYDKEQWGIDHIDKLGDTYWYIQYENARETALSSVEALEKEIEELEDTMEETQESLNDLEKRLREAKRKLQTGTLDAQNTYNQRMLAYNTAEETYNVAVGYLEYDMEIAKDTLQEAEEKLEEFNTNIQGFYVCSEYSGVVTDVPLSAGDTISTKETLLTLYNTEEVTMSVDMEEDSVSSIAEGDIVNITLTSYPEDVFQGIVTEIGDAEYNSDYAVTYYPVTVTVQGDVAGLYQGMTGDITFITKETNKVTYVSNRAIFRDGSRSYVKRMDAEGNIFEQDVTTGFSDGINVEIIEGLTEGDVVLIESKVSGE